MLTRLAAHALCGAIAFTTLAWSESDPPLRAPALDIVRDDAGILSGEEDRKLTAFLEEILAETGIKIMLVLVPSTAPDTSERYGGRLVEYWAKRGALSPANTVVVVLAVDERHLSVLAGRALPALQRELAGGGALSFVVPYLKEERYFDGMMALSRWLSGRIRSRGQST